MIVYKPFFFLWFDLFSYSLFLLDGNNFNRVILSSTFREDDRHNYDEMAFYGTRRDMVLYGQERVVLYEYTDAETMVNLRHSFASFLCSVSHSKLPFHVLVLYNVALHMHRSVVSSSRMLLLILQIAVASQFANRALLTLLRQISVIIPSFVTAAYQTCARKITIL